MRWGHTSFVALHQAGWSGVERSRPPSKVDPRGPEARDALREAFAPILDMAGRIDRGEETVTAMLGAVRASRTSSMKFRQAGQTIGMITEMVAAGGGGGGDVRDRYVRPGAAAFIDPYAYFAGG